MNTEVTNNWYEVNQRYLSAALNEVRSALERYVEHMHSSADAGAVVASGVPDEATPTRGKQSIMHVPDKAHEMESGRLPDTSSVAVPSALESLCAAFNLSPFERDILLLCAGMELDTSFASLCATAQGDSLRSYPTFRLALDTLSDAHWSAFTPGAPLRRWRLIEVEAGSRLAGSLLRVDERILHYLVGLQYRDERLAGLIEPVRTDGALVPSHDILADRLAANWTQAANLSTFPVIQLCGNEILGKRGIAAAACERIGLDLSMLSAYAVPTNPAEFDAFLRLWEREAILSSSALFLDCDDIDAADAVHERAVVRLMESVRGVLIVSSRERRRTLRRPMITFDVGKPTPAEQRHIWQNALGSTAAQRLDGKVDSLVSQFNLSATTILSAGAEALGQLATENAERFIEADELDRIVWETCRIQARPRLDDLAQRIESTATWDDLVLPEQQRQVLREIAIHVRQRARVYETWGFATRGTRGLGISALFAGASGTGKTMAAEVLANELRLDLYRIDLSQVVSKYIGETEKNLRRVFDAAEEAGAILLFDEADALFGKRSEVKDSHDRYANIEISYLLQRMEAYRGLAILTTNMKSALDSAFLRRIRFVVQFPFPDAGQRSEIWRRIFPSMTPTKGLDIGKLARLNIAGGNIRNIALNAAFLAADAGEPVRMIHLLRAARSEYTKLERTLTEAEIGGWQ